MKQSIRSLIVLFCEAIWIYFVLMLFLSAEYDEAIFVNAFWWVVAGLAGYGLNRLIAAKVNYVFSIVINGLVVAFFIVKNWQVGVPEGALVAGVFISVAVFYVYVRGASLVYKAPTRMHMLQRFEFTIFIYIALLLLFSFRNWDTELFHLLFLGAIFATLFGLILSLDAHEDAGTKRGVHILKVGNPRGLLGVIISLFIAVIALCAILFLPVVRDKLQHYAFAGIGAVMWALRQIGSFIEWLLGKADMSESGEPAPEMEIEEGLAMEEMAEEVGLSLPVEWIVGGLGLIALIIIVLIFGRFLKHWKPDIRVEEKGPKAEKAGWKSFMAWCRKLVARTAVFFRTKFARFYKKKLYWHFMQVERWGAKKGFVRNASDTPKEYVDRIIAALCEMDIEAEEREKMAAGLRTLKRDYVAAYYGKKEPDVDYSELIQALKKY